MERALTADEKIRRAEEIYQRRRMNETRKTTARVNVADTQKDYSLFKKNDTTNHGLPVHLFRIFINKKWKLHIFGRLHKTS